MAPEEAFAKWDTKENVNVTAEQIWLAAVKWAAEEAARPCFDEATLCGAPIHCGCREKIASAIRARFAAKEE